METQGTQIFNGIEVKWSGVIGHSGRKFELSSKRAVARMIVAGEISHAEARRQLRCSNKTTYDWVKDYHAGHFVGNQGSGHYGTRRGEQISLVGRLSTEVQRLTSELEVAKDELKRATAEA
jgi:hypothetical protein